MQSCLDLRGNRLNQHSDFTVEKRQEGRSIISVTYPTWPRFVCKSENESEVGPVILHIRGRTAENNRRDFCAVFEFPLMRIEPSLCSIGDDWAREAYISRADCCKDKLKQFVFVRILEIPEHGEEGREFWVRSIVRLEKLDHCPHGIADSAEPPLLNVPLKTFVTITYGEHEAVRVGGRIGTGFVDGHAIHEMVKNTSEIVDAVCDDQRPAFNIGLPVDVENGTVACGVGICFVGEAVRVTIRPFADFFLDGLSMFVGAS